MCTLYPVLPNGNILQNYRTISPLGRWQWCSQESLVLPHPLPCDTPPSLVLATTNLFSISLVLSGQECYVNGIIQYTTFGYWLFSLSIILWKFIQVVACITSPFLYCWVVFHNTDMPVCWTVHSMKDIWIASRLGLLWIKLLYALVYRFLCEHIFLSLA